MFRAMFSPIITSTWLYLQLLILSIDINAGWCHGWDVVTKMYNVSAIFNSIRRLASVLFYWSPITAAVPMCTITTWSRIRVSFKNQVTNILKPKTLFWLWCIRVTCVADGTHQTTMYWPPKFNSLNAKFNPICLLLALLGVHHILHFSRLRVKHSFRGRINLIHVSVARKG